MDSKYITIPTTEKKVYEGSIVILNRLPNLKWILHNGYYNYNGKRKKGWYFSSIPADTEMPVFNEDLVAMTVLDDCKPSCHPHKPCPPGPHPRPEPVPPAPIPQQFTPEDRKHLDAATLTVDTIEERDALSGEWLQNGKIVRVNDIDGEGTIDYFSWDSASSSWIEASFGYRYMTSTEIMKAVADDIVDIVWSNENGALVVTNRSEEPKDPIQLLGVAHDPIYIDSEMKLSIPVYGQEAFTLYLPGQVYIKSVRFEPHWVFETKVAPAIVVVVTDGGVDKEIAGDASGIVNIHTGAETATTRVIISTETGEITSDVKLSSIVDNPLKVDNEGLWVDLSGVVDRKEIDAGFLLVADGNGQFTYGGDGIELETSTAIADLENPEKKVVTANLIADAIAATFSALQIDVEGRIADLTSRVAALEEKLAVDPGADGVILVTSGDGLDRSAYKVGGSTLDTGTDDTVATEEAVVKALSWRTY